MFTHMVTARPAGLHGFPSLIANQIEFDHIDRHQGNRGRVNLFSEIHDENQ
jgi:hypothetical protein